MKIMTNIRIFSEQSEPSMVNIVYAMVHTVCRASGWEKYGKCVLCFSEFGRGMKGGSPRPQQKEKEQAGVSPKCL